MRNISGNSKHLAKANWLVAVLLIATVEALAQTRQQPSRQVLVSIPDRKLAVLEDGRVLKVFPVAVGAEASPSPAGEFQIINRLTNPTYYHKGTVIGPGPANPLGSRWMGLSASRDTAFMARTRRAPSARRPRTAASAWPGAIWSRCSRWCAWATRL